MEAKFHYYERLPHKSLVVGDVVMLTRHICCCIGQCNVSIFYLICTSLSHMEYGSSAAITLFRHIHGALMLIDTNIKTLCAKAM